MLTLIALRPRVSSGKFLQLPPSCRAFHASPRSQFLETLLIAPHAVFEGIHSWTGLPWVYTIPLAALTFRTVCILPLSYYTRRINQRQVALSPVLQSWGHQLKKEAMAEAGHLGPVKTQSVYLQKVRRKRSEIYRRWNCQLSKTTIPLLQLPIFLLGIETLRMMSGTELGLLGEIVGLFTNADSADTTNKFNAFLEPGFATGGALWFPDLTKADPQCILSFVLSTSILVQVFGTLKAKNPSKGQIRMRRALGVMGLAAGPLLLHLPSGMLVYWISSSIMAQAQGLLIDKYMPLKPFVPCKPRKPLRIGQSMLDRFS